MKTLFSLSLVLLLGLSCAEKEMNTNLENRNLIESKKDQPQDLVLVKGGTFVNTKSNLYGKFAGVKDFYIGRYEVTQRQWMEVMNANPSKFKGDSLPVENVSWYDCIEFCNRKSLKEGLAPYYIVDKTHPDPNNKNELDSIKWRVTYNVSADGYRLPTEAEWEYAAGGGRHSKSFRFAGSNSVDSVAWHWQNSGDKYLDGFWTWSAIQSNNNRTQRVGSKSPNELGLYDMSGNVREWCEDWYEDGSMSIGLLRVWRGGGWMGGDFSCESSFRGSHQPNGKGADQGLRICRN